VTAKKLTAAEAKWLASLQRVFQACPSKRLGCYTIGDAGLSFYDKDVATAWREANGDPSMDAGPLHAAAGSELGDIHTKINIDSCAG